MTEKATISTGSARGSLCSLSLSLSPMECISCTKSEAAMLHWVPAGAPEKKRPWSPHRAGCREPALSPGSLQNQSVRFQPLHPCWLMGVALSPHLAGAARVRELVMTVSLRPCCQSCSEPDTGGGLPAGQGWPRFLILRWGDFTVILLFLRHHS